jgi:tetratricopeptide (TPR) repeat protein
MSPFIRLRIFAFCAAVSVLVWQPAFAQRGGAGGGGTTPGGGGTAPGGAPPGGGNPSPGRTPTQGPNQTPTTPQPGGQPNAPIFLSGRVMLDDGTPPPNRVAIQRICTTTPRTEGYTDSRGYFSIQLGSSISDSLQDASTSGLPEFGDPGGRSPNANFGGGISERQLMNCELRAYLPGYQSQSISLANRRALDNPDLGTILLHRLGASEGTTVSATTLSAPKDAKKAYEKGLDLAKKKKMEEARTNLEKAVALYPRYSVAWHTLGKVEAAQGQLDAARQSFDQSVQADPKFVPPYVEIAQLQLRAREWQQLADTSEKATKLDPFSYPQLFFYNAVANYNLHKPDAAEESVRRAQKLDTRHQIPQLSHLLGVILADRQDFTAAAEQMRDYLKFAPEAQDASTVRTQLEQLEKLAKTSATGTPQ